MLLVDSKDLPFLVVLAGTDSSERRTDQVEEVTSNVVVVVVVADVLLMNNFPISRAIWAANKKLAAPVPARDRPSKIKGERSPVWYGGTIHTVLP